MRIKQSLKNKFEKNLRGLEGIKRKNVEKADKGSAREASYEKKTEKVIEEIGDADDSAGIEQVGEARPFGGVSDISNAQRQYDRRRKIIEKVLEENLEEVYLEMTPEKQREFAQAGEEAARAINILLDKAMVKVEKIIALLKRWLSVIPNINKFFLEQTAKIKADKIIKIKRK